MKISALTGRFSWSPLRYKGFAVAGTLVSLLLTICCSLALAQNQRNIPGDNLEIIGIPPIPASLPHEVQPYLGIYGLPIAGWDVGKREILLKGLSSVAWISRVESAGASPKTTPMWSLRQLRSNGF